MTELIELALNQFWVFFAPLLATWIGQIIAALSASFGG